jgi:hypothetical protein
MNLGGVFSWHARQSGVTYPLKCLVSDKSLDREEQNVIGGEKGVDSVMIISYIKFIRYFV